MIITDKDFYAKEELYISIYRCPICGADIIGGDNYCQGCGEKITWNRSIVKVVEKKGKN